jgi:tetratricopeptide (TPR) repeat protein
MLQTNKILFSVTALLLIVIGASHAFCAIPVKTADYYFDRAQTLRDPELRIRFYTKTLELDKSKTHAYLLRGQVYDEMKNYQRAINDYTSYISADSKNPKAWALRAEANYNLGNSDKAARDYSRAIELEPENVEFYYKRASVYAANNQHTLASEDYSKAVKLAPEDPNLYFNRGNTYYLLGEYREAIKDYTKTVDLNDKFAEAYFKRGNSDFRINDKKEAIKDYILALNATSNDKKLSTEILYNRGVANYALGNYNASIEDFTYAISDNPDNTKIYFARGFVYCQIGQYQNAQADYEHIVNIDGNNPWTHFSLANALYREGNYSKALTQYTNAIELENKHPEFYVNRGLIYIESNNYKKAIEDFDHAIKLKPKNSFVTASILTNKAIALKGIGKNDDAKDELHRAIRTNDKYVPAYLNMASLLEETGERDKALETYSDAISSNPKQAVLFFNRANLYVKADRLELAVQDYTKAIELNENFEEAYNNRSNALIKLGFYQSAKRGYNTALEINPMLASAKENLSILKSLDLNDNRQSPLLMSLGKSQIIPEEPTKPNSSILKQSQISDSKSYITPSMGNAVSQAEKSVETTDPAKIRLASRKIRDYSSLLDLNPNSVSALINRANAYYDLGEFQNAVSDYQKAQNLQSKPNSEILNQLGKIDLLNKDFENAKVKFDASLNADPDNAQTYIYTAYYYWTSSKNEKLTMENIYKGFDKGFDRLYVFDKGNEGYDFLSGLAETTDFKEAIEKQIDTYSKPVSIGK